MKQSKLDELIKKYEKMYWYVSIFEVLSDLRSLQEPAEECKHDFSYLLCNKCWEIKKVEKPAEKKIYNLTEKAKEAMMDNQSIYNSIIIWKIDEIIEAVNLLNNQS